MYKKATVITLLVKTPSCVCLSQETGNMGRRLRVTVSIQHHWRAEPEQPRKKKNKVIA